MHRERLVHGAQNRVPLNLVVGQFATRDLVSHRLNRRTGRNDTSRSSAVDKPLNGVNDVVRNKEVELARTGCVGSYDPLEHVAF